MNYRKTEAADDEQIVKIIRNSQAVGFYKHLGSETYKRAECDEEDNPYLFLYMKPV